MLDIRDLSISYGVVPAVKAINLKIKRGQIVSLIGTNGSGKTTTLRAISGLAKVNGGQIIFEGNDLTNSDTYKIVEMGISHVPEGRGVFPNLTVLDNLIIGAFIRNDKEGVKQDLQEVFSFFPHLEKRKNQLAGTLSGGEQQMLAIGRAIMAKPKLLLLDEPSMGLAPIIVKEIFKVIKQVNDKGTTILLVEQNSKMALSIANYGYVLETGKIVAEGNVEDLKRNDLIRTIYLG
ncbi:ATP-binding cassette domain-containing protein [Clostridium aminobutyricum]|uniref:ABC transporter ATP-binding protein n=1 Tax=Clostridium aminobutyricum TaxID=33953 RepID=A0A939IJW8_CLOAM|nr:ABC transporter ATP-binding protein [Clostridium aminobutyricum]